MQSGFYKLSNPLGFYLIVFSFSFSLLQKHSTSCICCKSLFYFSFIYVVLHVCMSEQILQKLTSSFHHIGPRGQQS